MSPSPADDACLKWRKSTRSNANNNDCVEVAQLPKLVAVRDSKNPDGSRLAFTRTSWRSFSERVKGQAQ